MFLGIAGGWIAGVLAGVVSSADYVKGIQDSFVPFNIVLVTKELRQKGTQSSSLP